MNLEALAFHVSSSIRSVSEVLKIEVDLVPSRVESDRHSTIELSYFGSRRVVAHSEPSLRFSVI